MFPLFQKELPTSAQELAVALNASLLRALDSPQYPVVVRENVYPHLDEIAVNLSGAKIRMDVPRPSFPLDEGEPAITARHLILTAHPLTFGAAAVDLDLDADGIVLHQNRDAAGNVFLFPHRADTGRIAISIQQMDLETLIAEIAKREAGSQGIVIEDILLHLRSHDSRSLGAELRVQARKLFFAR